MRDPYPSYEEGIRLLEGVVAMLTKMVCSSKRCRRTSTSPLPSNVHDYAKVDRLEASQGTGREGSLANQAQLWGVPWRASLPSLSGHV
jgi:hypothetical protein